MSTLQDMDLPSVGNLSKMFDNAFEVALIKKFNQKFKPLGLTRSDLHTYHLLIKRFVNVWKESNLPSKSLAYEARCFFLEVWSREERIRMEK